MLAVFLEKDNLKLLVYKGKARTFAGQITFSQEILRDAFVADATKFSAQVKVAFAQKPVLKEETEVVLFLPPDKTFTKTMDTADSLESFVQTLPYFKEELIIANEPVARPGDSRVTHVAFEKKLVEDLQRPFLESGKTVLAVRSAVGDLVSGYPADGEYFLLIPFEKEVGFAVAANGGILEASAFKADVFVTRFGEYVANHNLGDVKVAYTLGVFPGELAEKLHHAQNLTINALVATDVYDLVVASYRRRSRRGLGGLFRAIDFSGISGRLPGSRRLFLLGAAIIGFVLVFLVVKNVDRLKLGGKKQEVISPVVAPPPAVVAPEAKPADYKVRVLNGTLVEGEAGRLGDKLKAAGFDVVETKNATSAGFVTTKLRLAAGVPDKITTTVKTILADSYDTIAVEPLASDSAGVKIEIIIGKKK